MVTHRAYAALFVEAVGLVGARSTQPKAAYDQARGMIRHCAPDSCACMAHAHARSSEQGQMERHGERESDRMHLRVILKNG